MSKLNDILNEYKTRLLQLTAQPTDLTGRVVIAYNSKDLLDTIKTAKNFPIIGIVYEGMRSTTPNEPKGLTCEVVVSFVLMDQGPAIVASDNKRVRDIDYLEAMRGKFLGHRSAVTGHMWGFMVESPIELIAGMVCWTQRWSLTAAFKPNPTNVTGP